MCSVGYPPSEPAEIVTFTFLLTVRVDFLFLVLDTVAELGTCDYFKFFYNENYYFAN